jgi:hypothetical protein
VTDRQLQRDGACLTPVTLFPVLWPVCQLKSTDIRNIYNCASLYLLVTLGAKSFGSVVLEDELVVT